jgi:hypothetical protein
MPVPFSTRYQRYQQIYKTLMTIASFISIWCACFFPNHLNVTTWTVAYAIPWHAFKLYDTFKVGYGIISQQEKEAKHSGVKNDLALSNRSLSQDASGNWWQVMRANYVRSFYLPEHQPMPATYKSHFQSRVPPHCESAGVCNCGRDKDEVLDYCETCIECCQIVGSAQSENLSEDLIKLLKPLLCTFCGKKIILTKTLLLAKQRGFASFLNIKPCYLQIIFFSGVSWDH